MNVKVTQCTYCTLIFVCFVFIWASGRYSCNLIPAYFHLACSTWGLAQKCPERTTLSPHSSDSKGCWSHASVTSLLPRVGLEPAKDAVEQWQCLNQLSQPGRLEIRVISIHVKSSLIWWRPCHIFIFSERKNRIITKLHSSEVPYHYLTISFW